MDFWNKKDRKKNETTFVYIFPKLCNAYNDQHSSVCFVLVGDRIICILQSAYNAKIEMRITG